jgi:sugar phosphate isomerase/epimerase
MKSILNRVSVSNLAWKKYDTHEVLNFLKELGIQNIEVSPSKITGFTSFKDIEFAKRYRNHLYNTYGITVCSVQSIMYGSDLVLFDSKNTDSVLEHFENVFKFAKAIGSNVVVLGSPVNRRLSKNQSINNTVDILSKISNKSSSYGISLALEANPSIYKTNFINSYKEAYNYIKDFKFNNLYINLDFGSLRANREDLNEFEEKFFLLVKHLHISEPYLNEIQFDNHIFNSIDIVRKYNVNCCYSIETKELAIEELKIMIIKTIGLLSSI